MNNREQVHEPFRIAAVGLQETVMHKGYLAGLFHRAELEPDVVVREFDLPVPNFRRDVLQPLRRWRPHGLLLRFPDEKQLGQLRAQLPGVPAISTISVPSALVDALVVCGGEGLMKSARDHFRKWGVPHVALFCAAQAEQAGHVLRLFRSAVPGGPECVQADQLAEWESPGGRKRLKPAVLDWLKGLPKPVGIVTLETYVGEMLLMHCRRLKLRVPQEVQIIGMDSADRCLANTPRLSSFELPNRRVGEVALETLLRHLRGGLSLEGQVIRIDGASIVARDTTGPMAVGRASLPGALNLMQAHAAVGLTASQAARLSGVGRTTLYKNFAQTTGATPARYLRKQRIENACRQLRETADPIKEIAERCGFNSPVAFIRFFRRHLDTTPTAYRRQPPP